MRQHPFKSFWVSNWLPIESKSTTNWVTQKLLNGCLFIYIYNETAAVQKFLSVQLTSNWKQIHYQLSHSETFEQVLVHIMRQHPFKVFWVTNWHPIKVKWLLIGYLPIKVKWLPISYYYSKKFERVLVHIYIYMRQHPFKVFLVTNWQPIKVKWQPIVYHPIKVKLLPIGYHY